MTPLETRLWRALNVEPEGRNGAVVNDDWSEIIFNDASDEWVAWIGQWAWFANRKHPADRLAYFEGKVREAHPVADIRVETITASDGKSWSYWWATWKSLDSRDLFASARGDDEHTARLTAAHRALIALGMVNEGE